jgi:hypothetical protein
VLHAYVQAPRSQPGAAFWYGPQAFPQAPQFFGSMATLVHVMAHWFGSGALQTTPQTPAAQSSPSGHGVPQAPQLLLSDWVLVQVPPQFVLPAVAQPQLPAVQTSPAGHLVPQAPQLLVSVPVFAHVPLQLV